MSRTYSVTSNGYIDTIEADDIDEAVDRWRDEVESAEWGDDGCTVEASVTDEETEETEYFDVHIPADHAALIAATGDAGCGLDPDDHDWIATADDEGGLDENPGVWSTGRSMVFKSHCADCGLRRTEVSDIGGYDDCDDTEYSRD